MTPPSIETGFAVAVAIALAAVIEERGLSLLFEHPWYLAIVGKVKGVKELIALGVAYGICRYLGFDALGLTFGHPDVHAAGLWITAMTIAGGSKGSNKLFVELWDIKSSAARRAADPPPEGGG